MVHSWFGVGENVANTFYHSHLHNRLSLLWYKIRRRNRNFSLFLYFLLGPVMSFAKLTKPPPPLKRVERNIPLGGLIEDIRQAPEAHQADFKMFSCEY